MKSFQFLLHGCKEWHSFIHIKRVWTRMSKTLANGKLFCFPFHKSKTSLFVPANQFCPLEEESERKNEGTKLSPAKNQTHLCQHHQLQRVDVENTFSSLHERFSNPKILLLRQNVQHPYRRSQRTFSSHHHTSNKIVATKSPDQLHIGRFELALQLSRTDSVAFDQVAF